MTRSVPVRRSSTVYVFTHTEMVEAISISSWAGFYDAKERAVGLAKTGGFPLSFFFKDKQVWEVIDMGDEKNNIRLSELQPYAQCPPEFQKDPLFESGVMDASF